MIQSLIIYFLFAFILSRLGSLIAKQEQYAISCGNKTKFWSATMTILLLFFAFMCGVRYNVGVDHLSYLSHYKNFFDLDKIGYETNKESLFWGIVRIMRLLDIHFVFYFALLAFFQIFFIYYALRKECYLFVFLPWVLIFGQYYGMWMNGIRQMIVACIFVYSIELIVDRKLWKYMILIFICSFIHKSALILLPVYFLPNKDFFKNRYVTIGLLFVSLFIGANPAFISTSQSVSNILSFLDYKWYADNLETTIEDTNAMSFGIRHMSIFLINLLIIWFSPYMKKQFGTQKAFLFYCNLCVIFALGYELFSQASVLSRPFLYMMNFAMIMTAYLLYYLYRRSKTFTSINFLIYALTIGVIVFFTIYNIYDSSGVPGESVLFKFFWNYI